MSADENVLCHLYKVLCADVPNCGCNEPQAAYELVYRLLALAPFHQGTWRDAQALIGSSGAFQIVIAALTEAGLLEHGGTLGGSWLTDKGRWVLWAVEQAGGLDDLDDRLETAGFPHYDVPRDDRGYGAECTDACWRVPEGWEPTGSTPDGGAGPGDGFVPGPVVPAAPVRDAAVGEFDGIGQLLRAVTDPPSGEGPPWVYAYRPPEPEWDEDGEPAVAPVWPSLSFVTMPPRERPVFGTPMSPTIFLPLDGTPLGPVFTGCLAYLGEEER